MNELVTIAVGLILFSLIFFSRGILIVLTILCLHFIAMPFSQIREIGIQLRWVFFALFCVHVFGDIFLGRTVRKIKSFDILAVIFIIYAFLSTSYSFEPKLTLERSATLLALYISVFWIIWKYAYDRSPERVAHLILQIMAPLFIMGYVMIFVGSYQPFRTGRFTGIYGNANALGVMSSIILPISLWQFLETRKKNALFLFLLILLGLLLCVSRGSMNATVVALGYFIYTRSKKYKPLIFFLSVSMALILIFFIETLIKESFKIYIRAETIPILGGRLEVWPMVVDLIKDKPIFGYGFGTEDQLLGFKNIVLRKHAGAYVHNSYLGMLLQLGLVGFIIFFIPLFMLLFKELFSKTVNDTTSLLRYALRASLIAGLICCFYESWIYSVGNPQTFPFWIIVMLLVFHRYHDREKGIESSEKV